MQSSVAAYRCGISEAVPDSQTTFVCLRGGELEGEDRLSAKGCLADAFTSRCREPGSSLPGKL